MNFDRAVNDLKTWGSLRFVHQSVMKLLKPWLTLCSVYVREHRANPDLPSLAEGQYVRFATAEELLEAGTDPVYHLEPDFIHAAFEKGDLCIALFQGSRLLAYYWRGMGQTQHLDGLWVEFDAKYCYSYKAFTHPDFRRSGLQYTVSMWADPLLLERGYGHSIGFVETHNFPSVMASARRGSVRAGYAGYLRLFGRHYPFRSPGARRRGFRFFVPRNTRVC